MIFSILTEAIAKNELILVKNGMCRFHRRRDGVVVIREILVLPEARRNGIATQMVTKITTRYPRAKIRARCPVEYESNKFWQRIGFRLIGEEGNGINLWEFP